MQSVTVGDRIIDLHSFTGEVLEEKKWSTTQVSGSGGGYNAGSGQANPVSFSSTTSTHDQFFLRGDDGQEKAVELVNASVALRKGHRISVLWGVIKGNERGLYLAVYNHTTGELTQLSAAVNSLTVPPPPTLLLIIYVACFFAICLYGLGIIALITLLIYRSNLKKRLQTTLQSAVDTAVAQIKSRK